jgi:hypothetical protein
MFARLPGAGLTDRSLLYDRPFTFGERPSALAAHLRPQWRVPLVPLLLTACRQQRARWEQLVVVNWSLRSPEALEQLREHLAGPRTGARVEVRYEPSLVRAVNLARGLGLVEVGPAKWIRMTDSGRELVEEIARAEIFSTEREAINSLPKPLSQDGALSMLSPRG